MTLQAPVKPAITTTTAKRILFHAAGLATHRPAIGIPHLLGVQPTVMHSLQGLLPSHQLTGNRGNIIHAEAPAKLFQKIPDQSAYGNLSKLLKTLGESFADRIAENFDVVVVSLANFIRPNHDISALGRALMALDGRVPFIVLGAGVQGRNSISKISPGTVSTIGIINERAAVFGVRGRETRDWLHKNGFTRAEVLGCPSLYVYPQSIMGLDTTNARRKGNAASVLTAGHLSIREDAMVKRGLTLAQAFTGIDASYAMQDEFLHYSDLKKVANLYNDGNSEIDPKVMSEWLSGKAGLPINFRRYYYFNESGSWRHGALRHDVFIGDRFHGGIAALQAGLPAIFLKEDNRVGELTGLFDLPALSIREFRKLGLAGTLDEMLHEQKLAQMKATYRQRFRHFRKTMADQGLTVASRLPE
ncbi:Polysaccharide pyruvyl transferase [Paracoccus alcaliphilus]|uniref:Polysaccharide pyruvyl transferase n=1 Tax=Paracoccus alcaliphilus TaxID=34002 RepID=A0A1H8NIJ1_9RHOB|nr:polysaccharide pyruvyl transferase family protein [Paracoccus alcaliphilus]WCR20914.1 polysaccharide pyruvyl transferase family protein [Paracoccus alcaliphilus]SEO29414.1 Polysaccharide pyruvyl transferase [Paracoccus alcaliphilus]